MPPTSSENIDLWKQLVINQQEVISLQRNQLEFRDTVTRELSQIKDLISQAKGGWRMLVIVGGVGTTLLAGLAWVFTSILHK